MQENNFPKLHNATWPGIVGKGPDSEPEISFDDMLAMTAAAEVDGIKFDGIDIGLLDPHINIDSTDDEIKKLEIVAQRFIDDFVIAMIFREVCETTGPRRQLADLIECHGERGTVRDVAGVGFDSQSGGAKGREFFAACHRLRVISARRASARE